MPAIDESQLRRALSALRASRPNLRRAELTGRPERLASRRAIEKFLKTSFVEAGIDIEKLARMLADEQSEQRRALERQAEEVAKHLPEAHETFLRALDNRHRAVELLTGLQPPPGVQFESLTPFIIFEEPHFRYLVDSHIEEGNSWVKCNVGAAYNSDDTSFGYWFLWENERDYPVVVNASSSLVFTGHCVVSAAEGIFFGDMTTLLIQAELIAWEWWMNPPVPIPMPANPPPGVVVGLVAQGPGLFGSGPLHQSSQQDLSFQKVDFSYNENYPPYGSPPFVIPAKSAAVFTVLFDVSYTTDDHLNISNSVTADFATHRNYSVICPGLELQIFTPPPKA
jgi:hypothetical protein